MPLGASVLVHVGVVAFVWLAFARDAARPPRRSVVAVSIVEPAAAPVVALPVVEPAATIAPPPPPPVARSRPKARSRPVHGAPAPAPVAAAHPDSPPVPGALAAGPTPGAGGTGAGGAGPGGTGTGSSAGNDGIDHSSPPVPIAATTRQVMPYTAAAQQAHASGEVHVLLRVDREGRVVWTQLRKRLGYGLDEIALTSARRFRFRPARDASGAPTTGDVVWRFRFAPP